MTIENVKEKMAAIDTAQSAFASIESIRPGAIDPGVKRTLAELKLDLFDILDAQDPLSQPV